MSMTTSTVWISLPHHDNVDRVDQLPSHVHDKVDREQFGKEQKYEDVRVLCSDLDGLDVRHCGLDTCT